LKVLATRRYPGPAFDELGDVEVGPLEPRADVDAVVVANEPVDPTAFPSLRLVANFGVGYDRVGVERLRPLSVAVTNTPGVLDAATADLTWALILAARRGVVEGDRLVRAGEWTWTWADGFLSEALTGSTLGIVGHGRIGSAVARRAEGFELRVLSVRSCDGSAALDELLAESSIVTIHAPLTPETTGLIDARRLALLRDGAVLVNTARGEIVDEAALAEALDGGSLAGAGIDVFGGEPPPPDHPLLRVRAPGLVLAPHIAGSAFDNVANVARHAFRNIECVLAGRALPPADLVSAETDG
jgi:glyoxylate reductase